MFYFMDLKYKAMGEKEGERNYAYIFLEVWHFQFTYDI